MFFFSAYSRIFSVSYVRGGESILMTLNWSKRIRRNRKKKRSKENIKKGGVGRRRDVQRNSEKEKVFYDESF